MNIVKGEQQGDTYVWDHEFWDNDGNVHYGKWKSAIDRENKENDGAIVD